LPRSSRVQQPPGIEQYRTWLLRDHGIELDPRMKAWYETASQAMCRQVAESRFWHEFSAGLPAFADEYVLDTGYPLLTEHEAVAPALLVKTWDSFVLKTYRRNVVQNKTFPEPPEGGWLLPDRCLDLVGDVVRTAVVVKYLDGIRYLVDRLSRVASSVDVQLSVEYQARRDGYYAAHVAIALPVEIPTMQWDSRHIVANIEVQVTTQLQDVIRALLHRHYEAARLLPDAREDWQWDYDSGEFKANYLGHVLHYLEGMIMGIRSGQQ
jgi:hypothetical protein